ncbi:stalk domain-containing protein [Paenibacillus sinopodophylli]|uniref:stalk domain-containing protein n=1 Tax=Paenibacillus sinopodophylli TaxID=1837342 RepID=UPI00110CBB67|nr:stalk domain-containing protein [Paenibacillus sinopodophylli]
MLFSSLAATAYAASPASNEGRTLRGIVDIAFTADGDGVGIALDENGTVWYWQGNSFAKRGPSVPGAVKVTSKLLLKKDGTVWEWSEDSSDSSQVQGLPSIRKIASSNAGSIALDESGKLWAWGQSCQVALAADSKLASTICTDNEARDPLLDKPVLIAQDIVDADINTNLAFARKNGLIEQFYYGDNIHSGTYSYRLPGNRKAASISENAMFVNRGALFVLGEDGSLWYSYYGAELQQVASNRAFRSIDAGYGLQLHSLVVDSNGQVWNASWNAANTSSSIKLKGLSNIAKAAARSINSGLALDTSGKVWYWGGTNINYDKDSPVNASPKILPVQHELTVTWNGINLPLASAPIMRDGSLLVPMRELFEIFGTKVAYNNGSITATRGKQVIQLTVYSKTAILDGKKVQMSTAPTYVNGKTYVPLRFLSQSLGATVEWNAAKGDVAIITSK